jgi:hypothetical protein
MSKCKNMFLVISSIQRTLESKRHGCGGKNICTNEHNKMKKKEYEHLIGLQVCYETTLESSLLSSIMQLFLSPTLYS